MTADVGYRSWSPERLSNTLIDAGDALPLANGLGRWIGARAQHRYDISHSREHNAKAEAGKERARGFGAGARLHGDEPELRRPAGQTGHDLAHSHGRRTRRHILRYGRNLRSVHQRSARWRGVGAR